jgi:Fe-S oxidoreductase
MLIKAFLFQTVNIKMITLHRRIMGSVTCVEECPVNISPLSIIMDMRRYLVMEKRGTNTVNAMMTNIK